MNVATRIAADEQHRNGPVTQPQDRFFNPWRAPRTERAKALVVDVTRQVENYERHRRPRERRRRQKDQAIFEETIAAIVSDLAHAYLSGHEDGTAISRSNRELAQKSRYRSPVMGKKLPEMLNHLASPELEFVTQAVGFKNHFATRNQRTLISLGPRLKSRIDERKLDLSDFGRSTSEETIILKATKEDIWDRGQWIEYDDTEETNTLRDRLRQVNDWIERADIHHDADQGTYDNLDPGERRLRRIFTQGSFTSGGRLFGGLWQEMNRGKRLENLWISEEEVIEIDFGQMSPRLLYGMVGVEPPTPDAYLVPGLDDPSRFREGFKKLFSALLFTEKPLERKPQGTAPLLPKETVQRLVQMLEERHPDIAHFFGTGIGHQLQFRESQLMVEVLLRLRDRDIVALPVHDAVIIPASAEDVTARVMGEVFFEQVGIEAIIRRTSPL